MPYGLVFAGGGVRGACHMGVWKALNEMKIDVCAVCGTSIGAINAALYINGDFDAAQKLWSEITLGDIVDLPDEMKDSEDLFDIKNIFKLAREFKKEQGLEMKPLEKLIRETIDEKKIRKSPMDFGLVTYSLTDKKETAVYKSDIPEGELVKYLMASACLPGFKPVVIDNARFRDGGITNNMPVNMMIDKGIRDIIAVDVKGIGFHKEFNTTGCNIINISCSNPYTGTMDFDGEGIRKSMQKGYLETLSAFGKLYGNGCYITNDDYIKARRSYSADIIDGILSAAELLGLDDLKVWSFSDIKEQALKRYCDIEITNELVALLKEKRFDAATLSKLKYDWQRLYFLTKLLKTDGFDFIKSRVDKLLGNYYKAASALIYFEKDNN